MLDKPSQTGGEPVRVGDLIHLKGVFAGLDGRVTALSPAGHSAEVEITIFGRTVRTNVDLSYPGKEPSHRPNDDPSDDQGSAGTPSRIVRPRPVRPTAEAKALPMDEEPHAA